MNKDIVKHINDNALLIPNQLSNFDNVQVIFSDQNNAAFFKDIDGDLIATEFYTHAPLILYLESGNEELKTYDDKEFKTVKKGELFYLAKDMYYVSDYIRENSNLNAHLYFIDQDVISEFLEEVSHDGLKQQDLITRLPVDRTVKNFFKSTRSLYEGTVISKKLMKLKLLELLHLIYRIDYDKTLLSVIKRDFEKKNKKDILTFMNRHFLKALTINDFAELCSRSLSGFNKEFKDLYGITPKKWLIERRLQYAKEQLIEGKKTVTEVSFEIGYENTSHFIRLYKEKFGTTPKKTQKIMNY